MIKHIKRNHRELMHLTVDIRETARTKPWLTKVICITINHTIIAWAALSQGYTDWKFCRRMRNILDEHDRDMRKLGYKGP